MIRHTLVGSIAATAFMAAADKNSGANTGSVPPAPAPAAAAKATVTTLGIRADIAKPANARKAGAKSKYPFDELEVGQSFGVIGKDAASFSSIIYSAQQRHAVTITDPTTGQPATRMKKLKGGGTEIVEKKKTTRRFSAYDVDPKTDPENATVRVFRDE